MRKLGIVSLAFVCCGVVCAATNKVHIALEKPISVEGGIDFQKLQFVSPVTFDLGDYNLDFETPYLNTESIQFVPIEAAIGSIAITNEYVFNFLASEIETAFMIEDLSPAALEHKILVPTQLYSSMPLVIQNQPLHWAYPILNPKYCSTIYGIYSEMESYYNRGLPIPQELTDKMNKAVDLYFFLESVRELQAGKKKKQKRKLQR